MSRESTSQDVVHVVGHRLQKVGEPIRAAAGATHPNNHTSSAANGAVNAANAGTSPAPGGPTAQRPAARAQTAAHTPDRSSVLRQVVLVDREIDGLRDVAVALRDEFDFHITISGAEALNLLRDGAIDTIVVGQTLYSSTGLNVLAEARRHAPHTHRVLLANAVEAGSIERGTAAVAPFKVMQRPCTAEKLRELLKTNTTPDDEPLALHEEDSPPSRPTRPPTHTHDPADFEHVVMETTEPRLRRNKGNKGAAAGADSLPIIVYTDNAEFYQAITSALQDRHEIRLCTQLDRAAELAEMGLCPLLITDRAGTQVELQRISIALRSLDAGMISIASGSPDVGAALRKLLGTGALHSFLPKPINAPLVRLAVESAKRQYLQARTLNHNEPELNPAPVAPTLKAKAKPAAANFYVPGFQPDFGVDDFEESPWRRAAPKIAVGLVLVAGILTGGWYWWQHRPPVTDTVSTLTLDLDLAQRAFAAGRYSSPAEDSAVYYYSRALTAAPNDPAATTGLERTLERVIEQAEKALTEERLDAAAESIATVRTLQPANKRLPFLESQLDKERRRPANRRDQREAVATLPANADAAASLSQPITNSSQRQQLITRWLATARQRLGQDRLLLPENDNAEFYLRQVERVDPDNAAMQQGLREIGSRLLASGREALARQQLDIAKQRASDALRFGVDSVVIDKLRMDIAATASESARGNYLRLALQRTRDNRLLEPDRDSAKYYLGQLQRLDPSAAETEQALRALALKLIENADQALAQRQTNSATQMLNEARRLGFNGEEINAADARIRATRMPAPSAAAKTSAVNPPKAIKTVPPKFPEEAIRAGAEGWVDVRFRITADGGVADVTPIGSNTANQFTVQFERAAVAAIRQYKFEAREISETQTQSMTVRVQFKAQ